MDRPMSYPGALPRIEDLLLGWKNAMIDKAALAEAVLGQGTWVSGLACTTLGPTVVSGSAFAVSIGRGFIFSYQETDPNAYGVLGTDTATNILKTGINLAATSLGLTNSAPATAGYSQNFLVSANFQEQDTNQVAIPFYNPSAPATPTLTLEETLRQELVVFNVTGGTAATTGTQNTPSPPAGYVPLFVVTIHNGDTQTVSGQIVQAPAAPFLDGQGVGRGIMPGRLLNVQKFSASGTYTPTPGTNTVRVRAIGGGGGSGGTSTTASGTCSVTAGGNTGTYGEGIYSITPGATVAVTIGAAGAAGAIAGNGGSGGTTSFGAYLTCPGGQGSVLNGTAIPPYGVFSSLVVNVATGGNIVNGYERLGSNGMAMQPGQGFGGSGAPGQFGGGAQSGNVGLGYGSGGGGVFTGQSTSGVVGKAGVGGYLIVEEYA